MVEVGKLGKRAGWGEDSWVKGLLGVDFMVYENLSIKTKCWSVECSKEGGGWG